MPRSKAPTRSGAAQNTPVIEMPNSARSVIAENMRAIIRELGENPETIQTLIEPRGVAVICEARHFCMMMRGVEKQHSGAMTSAMLGAFRTDKATRNELLSLLTQRSAVV